MTTSLLASIIPKWSTTPSTQVIQHSDIPALHPHQAITDRNSELSALHRLPFEILHQIDLYLPIIAWPQPDRVAQMALRSTCRQFHSLLGMPKQGNWDNGRYIYTSKPQERWTHTDCRHYRLLLKSAAFRALCEKERNGALEEGRLVCSICQLSHRLESFSSVETQKKPEERSCIGSQGVLELCPHYRVTYAGTRLRPPRMVCGRGHQCVGSFAGLVRISNPTLQARAKGDNEVKAEIELRILEIKPEDGELEREKIIIAVHKARWRICPHLHTDSVSSWLPYLSNFSSPNPKARSNFAWFSLGRRKSDLSNSPTYSCPAEYCDTTFTLRREILKPPHVPWDTEYLVMRIERCFGKMESADDPRWIAQLVEASTLDDDQWGRKEQTVDQPLRCKSGSWRDK